MTTIAMNPGGGGVADEVFEPISFTARKVLQARARYTSIPLAREMASAAGVAELRGVRDWMRRTIWGDLRAGTYLQLRYRAISEALAMYPGSAVVEVAAGFSTRGMLEVGDREAYVETDLGKMAERKRRLVERVQDGRVAPNHRFMPLNVCDRADMRRVGDAVVGMRLAKPVVVIHEGLLMYLDDRQQSAARDNVAWFLRECSNGGAWITTDFSEQCQDVSWAQRVMSLRLRREVGRGMNYFDCAREVGRFLAEAGLRFEQRPNLEGRNPNAEVKRMAEGFRAWRAWAT